MDAPIVLTKSPTEISPITLDLTSRLDTGEEITDAVVGLVNPVGGVLLNDLVVDSPNLLFQLEAGSDGVTYGIRIDITTDLPRVFSISLAILVSSQLGNAYTIRNPEGIQTLLDTIQAGDVAIGNSAFMFPVETNLVGGRIEWDLLDNDGIVYANGNSFEYIISESALATKVEGRGIITVPTDMPVNISGFKYQVRWTLTLPSGEKFFSFENVQIVSQNLIPIGATDTVELIGDIAQLSLILPSFYDHVGIEVFKHVGSEKILSYAESKEQAKTPDGYSYKMYLDTSELEAELNNYIVIWKYWNDRSANTVFRETAKMFVVNASILSAVDDLKNFINRSHATIAHKQDMTFSVPALMTFLRTGRDAFNGSYGTLTQFTMTDATSAIRQFWIYFASLEALRSQFIAEGEKAFNFSGQAISLDVDRTQYYSQLAGEIQGLLDNQAKPFKQNLIKKGMVTGTGNMESIALRMGAIGSVGINISPASNWGRYVGKLGGSNRVA